MLVYKDILLQLTLVTEDDILHEALDSFQLLHRIINEDMTLSVRLVFELIKSRPRSRINANSAMLMSQKTQALAF